MIDALDCFPVEDRARISDTFEHLLPYVMDGEFAVVGGVAIRYFAISHGLDYPVRRFNDLDIIIRRPSSLSPRVTERFKISHHHDNPTEFFFAIVDPETRVKIDVFEWPDVEFDTIDVPLGGIRLPFQSIENQLAKTIFDTTKVFSDEVVDPKQFSDAKLLQPFADPGKTSRIFAQLYGDRLPAFPLAADAFQRAKETADQHPELVIEKPFHKPRPYQCIECVNDPAYPLTPLSDIYHTLGYIE